MKKNKFVFACVLAFIAGLHVSFISSFVGSAIENCA
jgi:hypothetical protein